MENDLLWSHTREGQRDRSVDPNINIRNKPNSYALAGLLVIMVMRMLGEMSIVNPSSGSFATYAREAPGPWASYTIGWLYWFFWVIVIAVEAIAGANVIQYWFPSLPSWSVSFVLTFLLTLSKYYFYEELNY